MTAKQAALIVPMPSLLSETAFNDGNTKDIIETIVEVDAESATREDLILLAQRLLNSAHRLGESGLKVMAIL